MGMSAKAEVADVGVSVATMSGALADVKIAACVCKRWIFSSKIRIRVGGCSSWHIAGGFNWYCVLQGELKGIISGHDMMESSTDLQIGLGIGSTEKPVLRTL